MSPNKKICRTCFYVGETDAIFFPLDDIQPNLQNTKRITIKDKISACVPELEIDIVSNAVICGSCSKTLDSAYKFRNKCLEVDEKIQTYIQVTPGICGEVDLGKIVTSLSTTLGYIHSDNGRLNENSTNMVMIDSSRIKTEKLDEIENNVDTFTAVKLEPMDYSDELEDLQQQNNDLDNETCDFGNDVPENGNTNGEKSDNGKSFKCPACGKRYKREASLIVHMKVHDVQTDSSSSQIPGEENSGSGTSGMQDADIKEFLPKQVEPSDAICEVCNKSFYSKSNLSVHMRIHTGEKPFKCQICEKAFTQKVYLTAHERTHTGEKPFNCSLCDKSFAQKSYLRTHMIVHTGVRHHICKVCGKGCAHTGDLNNHMRIHTGEKPYKCEHCGKCFTQSVHLRSHVKIHSGQKPYACTLCDARYTEKRYLRKHMKIHSGERPFRCTICAKSFHEKYILSEHMKCHTGEKPCICKICNKQYTKMSHLNEHMRTHTGEKPYKCVLCGVQFAYKQSLNAHLKAHVKLDAKNALTTVKFEIADEEPLIPNSWLGLNPEELDAVVDHNMEVNEKVINDVQKELVLQDDNTLRKDTEMDLPEGDVTTNDEISLTNENIQDDSTLHKDTEMDLPEGDVTTNDEISLTNKDIQDDITLHKDTEMVLPEGDETTNNEISITNNCSSVES